MIMMQTRPQSMAENSPTFDTNVEFCVALKCYCYLDVSIKVEQTAKIIKLGLAAWQSGSWRPG